MGEVFSMREGIVAFLLYKLKKAKTNLKKEASKK